MPEDDDTPEVKILRKHCEELGEHFDTVHIFCTRHEPGSDGGTVHASYGLGNWFARYGQVIEWSIRENEKSRLSLRNDF